MFPALKLEKTPKIIRGKVKKPMVIRNIFVTIQRNLKKAKKIEEKA
jgi:hypothetical protein